MIQETHIDAALKELFDNLTFTPEPAGLYDPLRYMIQIGGKRIRPRLCLTAYALYKDSLNEEILSPAAAIERTCVEDTGNTVFFIITVSGEYFFSLSTAASS